MSEKKFSKTEFAFRPSRRPKRRKKSILLDSEICPSCLCLKLPDGAKRFSARALSGVNAIWGNHFPLHSGGNEMTIAQIDSNSLKFTHRHVSLSLIPSSLLASNCAKSIYNWNINKRFQRSNLLFHLINQSTQTIQQSEYDILWQLVRPTTSGRKWRGRR